ncbi:hypothetical protein ABVT39_027171 [Epinephelus coioides]
MTRVLAQGSPGTGAPNFKGLPPGRKEGEKPHGTLANTAIKPCRNNTNYFNFRSLISGRSSRRRSVVGGLRIYSHKVGVTLLSDRPQPLHPVRLPTCETADVN